MYTDSTFVIFQVNAYTLVRQAHKNLSGLNSLQGKTHTEALNNTEETISYPFDFEVSLGALFVYEKFWVNILGGRVL